MLLNIGLSWIITLPAGATCAVVSYLALRSLLPSAPPDDS
jgi:phosphate/sulfate permease